MPDRSSVLLAWLAGGTGVVLVYSAYKNVGPMSVLTGNLTGDKTRTTIDSTTGVVSGGTTGDTGSGDYSRDQTVPVSPGESARLQQIANRTLAPTLIPLPTQPWIQLDVQAVASFMKVQAEYGKPIPLTGGYRSYADQAKGYQQDPSRFAAPGKSLHEVGLAIDINTDKTNVGDPKLVDVMSKAGWFRVGKSGDMHWSFGVAG